MQQITNFVAQNQAAGAIMQSIEDTYCYLLYYLHESIRQGLIEDPDVRFPLFTRGEMERGKVLHSSGYKVCEASIETMRELFVRLPAQRREA